MLPNKKKILLLGGSAAQIPAIETAKNLGLYTIVCDYLPDNPGQYIADKFYLASTTDKEQILKIATEENIHGIVAYSSDPAAPTAAYVANKLNLPGLPYNTVKNFCEKQLFRNFLFQNDFNIPKSKEIKIPIDFNSIDVSDLTFPVIIKPTDSSGSKGVTVLQDEIHLKEALDYAARYSRNNIIIIEEFIERDHPHVIEGEVFVVNGEVKSWGLINSIRDNNTNPLLPAAYSYPLEIEKSRLDLVKHEINRLIKCAGITSGPLNIELIIDKNNKLYFLDVGPRNGGNRLPEFISLVSGKNLLEATINNAMGKSEDLDVLLENENGTYWGLGVIHSAENGILYNIKYKADVKNALRKEFLNHKTGEKINKFERCDDLLGLIFLNFTSKEDMNKIMENLTSYINIDLK